MSTTRDTLPDRPRPAPTPESQPYWDGLREHRLRLQRCRACGTLRHYPRPLCAACHTFEHDWVEASGRGVVHSWTVSHHAFHPAFRADTPYVTVTVDLEEGVRAQGPLRDADAAALAPGVPVEVCFEDVDDALTLPAFRLAATSDG